ncbi:polyketide synthase pks15, partial [Streptomyces clavuligerus]
MGCRFPSASSPGELWDFTARGGNAAAPGFPADRGWDLAALTDPDPEAAGSTYVQGGSFIDGVGDFDASFFGISPREALAMDPQQRLLLEVSWEALEHAGIDPTRLADTPAGVYFGVVAQEYGPRVYAGDKEHAGHLTTGTTPSVASGRVSYVLGLEGPAVTVDTACSSSLAAVHIAARALRAGDCSLALAGGANVVCAPSIFVGFGHLGALAPNGMSKPFSADADGFGVSEGAGVLVLERLSDARRNGHTVLALLRGTAIAQDGASEGLSAPSEDGQRRVIGEALADAGLTAADVDVVEAHGTGTRVGDPIEARALIATYGAAHRPDDPLLVGSVKSNIGHAQAASGVAGIIKMVEAIRHGEVPGTLHLTRQTDAVDWSAGTVRVVGETRPWPTRPAGVPRRAAVSSFGISGTNAHVIVEQAPTAGAVGSVVDVPSMAAVPAGADGDGGQPLAFVVPDSAAAGVLSVSAGGGTRHEAAASAVTPVVSDPAAERSAAVVAATTSESVAAGGLSASAGAGVSAMAAAPSVAAVSSALPVGAEYAASGEPSMAAAVPAAAAVLSVSATTPGAVAPGGLSAPAAPGVAAAQDEGAVSAVTPVSSDPAASGGPSVAAVSATVSVSAASAASTEQPEATASTGAAGSAGPAGSAVHSGAAGPAGPVGAALSGRPAVAAVALGPGGSPAVPGPAAPGPARPGGGDATARPVPLVLSAKSEVFCFFIFR